MTLSADIPCALLSKVSSLGMPVNNVYKNVLHWKSGKNHNIDGKDGFNNALRDAPFSECVNHLLTRNSLVHMCLLPETGIIILKYMVESMFFTLKHS